MLAFRGGINTKEYGSHSPVFKKGLSANAWFKSLGGTLYTRFNEVSGNLINYGSDGNSATVTGALQGQTGQLGPNEAYLFDGVDDLCTFANADIPGTVALTTQRWCWLLNAASLGESSVGNAFNTNTVTRLLFRSSNRLQAVVDTDGTDANVITNVNEASSTIGGWALVFVDYDDANVLGLGRKIRIIIATASSAATLLTLSTDTAATGTIVAPATDLTIGNNSGTTQSFDGLQDVGFRGPGLWSPAGNPGDLSLCEQGRVAVFG